MLRLYLNRLQVPIINSSARTFRKHILAPLFLLVLHIVVLSCTLAAADKSWSQRMAEAAMARWPDGQLTRGDDKIDDWAYDKSVLLTGFSSLWINTRNPVYLNYIQRSMDRLVTSEGEIPSYQAKEVSLDEIALGRMLLFLHEQTHNPKYSKAAAILRHQLQTQPRTASKGFWHKKRYPNQMWLDGLYMAEPFYAEYARRHADTAAMNELSQA